MAFSIFIISCLLKVLMMPSYRSTDFEVHRNWMAITHSLPMNEWYTDSTSQWTLDYPPFFAYFEFLLSHIAAYFDKEIVVVGNLGYDSPQLQLFHRISVILTDFLLYYGIIRCCKGWKENNKRIAVIVLTLFNSGLFIVDHIHFQYNGFLLGILLLSISFIGTNDILKGAAVFTVLLNFKHIFLYIAPVYFIYLLRVYCLDLNNSLFKILRFRNLLKLAIVVISVFALSFGPFISMGQLHNLKERLFPFKRGLIHSYWAANFWALYTFADLVIGALFNIKVEQKSTLGIVGVHENNFLPNISPVITWIITVISILPALYHLWKDPTFKRFILTLVTVSMSSFMFGWHVHEKAILMSIVPMCLLAGENGLYSKFYVMLSIFGNYALHPLIFTPMETFVKASVLLAYSTLTIVSLSSLSQVITKAKRIQFSLLEKAMLISLPCLYIFTELIHPLVIYPRYEFLPLLFTSVTCALGLSYVYIQIYRHILK